MQRRPPAGGSEYDAPFGIKRFLPSLRQTRDAEIDSGRLRLGMTGALPRPRGRMDDDVAYYCTRAGDVFTGAMCVIGIFLIAYRLTSRAIVNTVPGKAG